MEEVIKMQNIKNPYALDMASRIKKTVESNDLVESTLDADDEIAQLQKMIDRSNEKVKAISLSVANAI